ncbi:MAG TPA: DUF3991 and TOPRIM domain-containing protein [Terrimicrobiaceae bacterium]
MQRRADELEDFKSRINLSEYAAACGYRLDRKASSRNSAVMVRSPGEKIIIALGSDRHWIYFSVGEERDSGSIIDFVQNRQGGTLGEVRKELRPWLESRSSDLSRPPLDAFLPALEPASKDLIAVRVRYEAIRPIDGGHLYLENERGISAEVLCDPRFAGRIRIDSCQNAIFPHWNQDGLCGYEIKNRNFTGFAPGGEKGLWGSRICPEDSRLIIAETAIDALSYFALKDPGAARYISTAGALNPIQPTLILSAINKLQPRGEVILALDNDNGGVQLAEKISTLFGQIDAGGCVLKTDLPPTPGQDWNDVLQASGRK